MSGLPSWCICLKGGFNSEALPVGLDPRLRGDDEKERNSSLVIFPRAGEDPPRRMKNLKAEACPFIPSMHSAGDKTEYAQGIVRNWTHDNNTVV